MNAQKSSIEDEHERKKERKNEEEKQQQRATVSKTIIVIVFIWLESIHRFGSSTSVSVTLCMNVSRLS